MAYELANWIAMIFSIGLFSFFVLSFLAPLKKRDWRSVGIYEAFVIALFAEMYGFPLTVYILSSLFGMSFSFTFEEGHLWATLLARAGILDLNTGVTLVMVISMALILVGILLLAKGFERIHRAKGELVTDGIYAYSRHPQYLGILILTFAFLVQWPTLVTLAMWPILIAMYYRLARKEEGEMETRFGERYLEYKRRVPMLLPSLRARGIRRSEA